MKLNETTRNKFFKILPTLGGVFGMIFVMVGLVTMNGLEGPKRNKGSGSSTSFDLSQIKKKPKKKSIVQKVRPKKSKPKVAPPSLAGSLSGSSFGLGQFEFLGSGAEGLLGDASGVIMTEDTVDELPRASYRPPLKYPDVARKRGINGHVLLKLLVDASGNVQEVKLLASEPAGIFDQVAMTSVRDWTFEPANYKGSPVKVWVKQRISFNLN